MIAYKSLLSDLRAPFTGQTWREDGWVEADGPLVACRNGVHAFRAADLAYWLTDELLEVQLDGEIVESRLKLVARRGRLVRRIDAWDGTMRQAFADECLRHVARYAAEELRDAGLAAAAAGLTEAGDREAVLTAARVAADAAGEQGAVVAERLARYAEDAVDWTTSLPPSGVAFVAAHAARGRTRPTSADPFAVERSAQSDWLAHRLGLTSDAAGRT